MVQPVLERAQGSLRPSQIESNSKGCLPGFPTAAPPVPGWPGGPFVPSGPGGPAGPEYERDLYI